MMKKSVKIGIIAFLIVVGSIGIYGGLLYNAANQLETGEMEVTDLDIARFSLTCELTVEIFSPNGFTVKVDGGTFDIYINGTYLGSGVFGEFTANKEPSIIPVSVTIPITSINSNLLQILLSGGDFLITINIKSVILFGMDIELNISEDVIM